jgi:hypothetical protein
MPECTVPRAPEAPDLSAGFDEGAWQNAVTLRIADWQERSSGHRPLTDVKLLHTGAALCIYFRVEDRYMRCTRTRYQEMVCKDACVEFFTMPRAGKGYFNFELNCIGTMLLYYIQPQFDPPKREEIPADLARQVEVVASLSEPIPEENPGPRTWTLAMRIPAAVMEPFVGELAPLSGSEWKANFYKTASETSHPHWGAWAPLDGELSFHTPEKFAPLRFA